MFSSDLGVGFDSSAPCENQSHHLKVGWKKVLGKAIGFSHRIMQGF